MDPESLFLPVDEDEDRVWGERSFDDEEDVLGWNASANHVRFNAQKDSTILSLAQDPSVGGTRKASESSSRLQPYPAWSEDPNMRLEPTQRMSQVILVPLVL